MKNDATSMARPQLRGLAARRCGFVVVVAQPVVAHDLELDGVARFGLADSLARSALAEQEAVEPQVGDQGSNPGVDTEDVFDDEERHVVSKEAPEVDADGQVGHVDQRQVEQLVEELETQGARAEAILALAQLEQRQACRRGGECAQPRSSKISMNLNLEKKK